MKTIAKIVLLALCAVVLTTACSDDSSDNSVSLKFQATPKVEGALSAAALQGAEVVFTDTRNQKTTSFVLDANGMADVTLNRGTYNISIDHTARNHQGDDVVIALRMENYVVSEGSPLIIGQVSSLPSKALGKDFIFSEVFFNGERNSGRMMHPDQYIVLFNPTEDTLYADGVSIAVTQHLSWQNKQQWYDTYYPDRVPVGGFITIPGNGKNHAVPPGDRVVIAFTAIDHSQTEGYDHAVDLSGADFEVYWGPEAKDVDNPDVPNVLITENGDSYGFFLQPRGYVSPLVFRLKDGTQATIDAYVNEHTTLFRQTVEATEDTPAGEVDVHILSVPTNTVLDAVQTSDVPQDIKTRVIPEVLDRGKFLVNGCHRQELCIRKTFQVGNRTYYQDTNNSSEDMVMQNGQNSWPKGWRNNQ